MRKMRKILFNSLNTSVCIGIYCVSFSVYNSTKLDNKLLKSEEI